MSGAAAAMKAWQTDLPGFYLKPGEMIVRETATQVTTVLGSCVAVTLFDARRRIGAICHALLPECRKIEVCRDGCAEPYKYVNCVVPEMVRRLARFGIRPGELEVKLFGGADMFGNLERAGRTRSVGSQNVATAIGAIEACRLRLTVSDVGGLHGRKIFFHTHTGEVWLKRL